MKITSLRTPCVLIDQRRLERNIDRMQQAAEAGGKRLRPHAKTHKSPDLALTQMARGAVGICCAKLGEAEVFAERGIPDIRLPYPLNPVNADRVLSLLDRTRLSFIVDDFDVARGWSRVMSTAGRQVDILIKIDVGFHRCGIDPDTVDAVDFIARVAALPGLRLKGLLSHAGHAYGASSEQEVEAIARREAELLAGLKDQAAGAGVALEELSVGATPTARFSASLPGITELRPGNYVYYDRMQVNVGAADWDDCALTVLARVVSRPDPPARDPRFREQDADQRPGAWWSGARLRRDSAGAGRFDAGRTVRDRAAVGGARDRPCRRMGRRRWCQGIWCASSRITPAWCPTSWTRHG